MTQQLPPGIKNWHWRTKGCEAWAKTWLKSEIDGLEVDGVSVSVKDSEGDCEVGMRKSKLVTIYDLKITMDWKAETAEGEAVTGSLVALEVAHDMDEDEYVFESSISSAPSKEAQAFQSTAKKGLANKLRPIFQRFPKAMLETHGKDLLAEDDSANNSGASTPAAAAAAKSTPTVPSASTVASSTSSKAPFNTAVVKANGEFASDADGLFDFLTNAEKIPLWSRNPATMKPEVGAEMSLFGGNIAGKVTAVERPKSFTTTWRAPTWPENYYGTLETTLTQGSNSTTLDLRLSGVPVGKEDEAERNLNIFYINGLKQIGSVLPSVAPPSSSAARARPRGPKVEPPSRWLLLANFGVAALSFGVVGALGAAFYFGPSGPGGRA
ncbi:activator of Hsp90 ATPase [Leucosporidium creatinivorum]|uniref:Activator of Hsp90 ATPase n=1 Tax=Leucosporidium creatinivorum TaxID=106004 RepID=A0A1Y2D800_9BASI|nr:activator of Hsp90 ATPase [Leucosporidium creatinivorum]